MQAFGAFPELGLAEARAAHTASRQLVANGVNPVQARRSERESKALATMHHDKGTGQRAQGNHVARCTVFWLIMHTYAPVCAGCLSNAKALEFM